MPTPLELVATEASTCTRCALSQGRTQVVFGMGDPVADLMFIGEGPGAEEDRQGLPFVGRSGQLLDRLLLEELGITREQVYIANVVKCRPPGNRDPKPEEIDACRPYLQQQLDLIRPAVVVTLGRFAAQWLLETKEGITRLRGRSYPFAHGVLIPTLHPAAALRGGAEPLGQMRADFVRAKLALADARAAAVITLRTTSVDETKAVAAALAELARPGDLILLAGEMGAGKTAFAQGFAAGLGVLEHGHQPDVHPRPHLRGAPRACTTPTSTAWSARPRWPTWRSASCSTTTTPWCWWSGATSWPRAWAPS